MTDLEVNKIIAEFMGKHLHLIFKDMLYTNSLDALVPVWEKLENVGFIFRFDKGEYRQPSSYFLIDSVGDEYGRKIEYKNKTIQQAAAHATAKAILELKESDV